MLRKITLGVAMALCGSMSAQFSENFEGGVPGSMTQSFQSGTINWTDCGGDLGGATCPMAGTRSASFQDNSYTAHETSLSTPVMDLSSGAYKLSFTHLQRVWSGDQNSLHVEISTNGGTSWTNVVSYTGDIQNAVTETIPLASFSPTATTMIRFRAVNAYGYAVLLDDISVSPVANNDAAIGAITLNRYSNVSTDNTLSLNVTNQGSTPITSVEVNWNDGTADHIQTIATNIAAGANAVVNHPTSVNYATIVEKNMTVTISQVNGGADGDPSNNAGTAKFNTVSNTDTKRVLFEEGTGTWCGWCPRGAVVMDNFAATYPNSFIGIAVHNGDPMTVAAYDTGAGFGGFPSVNVDRAIKDGSVSDAAWTGYYNQRKDMTVPFTLSVGASAAGSNLTIDAKATFHTVYANVDYRLGVIIVEDDVTGTTSQYDQANYYAGGGSGVMGGYETLPNPVPAAQMVYKHVGRAVLGGYAGQAGSVPTAITDGLEADYTFNYTVPATSDVNKMHAVIVLIDQADGSILNAKDVTINQALSIEDQEALMGYSVTPNPADDMVNVRFNATNMKYGITVTDVLGRTVVKESYGTLFGPQSISVPVSDLKAGNYIVSVVTEGASFSKIIVVK